MKIKALVLITLAFISVFYFFNTKSVRAATITINSFTATYNITSGSTIDITFSYTVTGTPSGSVCEIQDDAGHLISSQVNQQNAGTFPTTFSNVGPFNSSQPIHIHCWVSQQVTSDIDQQIQVNVTQPNAATITVVQSPVFGGTFTLNPGGCTQQAALSKICNVSPASGGTTYTLTSNSTPGGYILDSITNSKGGSTTTGNSLTMSVSPGDTESFTINYSLAGSLSPDLKARLHGSNNAYSDGPLSVPYQLPTSNSPTTIDLQFDDPSGTCGVYKTPIGSGWPVNIANVGSQGSTRNYQAAPILENISFHVSCGQGSLDSVDVNIASGGTAIEVSKDGTNFTNNLNFVPSLSQLFWVRMSTVNTTSCTGTFNGTSIGGITPGFGSVSSLPYSHPYYPSYQVSNPASFATAPAQSTYTFDCTGINGTHYVDTATVNIIVPPTLSVTPGACGASQINLSWTAVNSASSYNVYRGGALRASGLTGTTYTDSPITVGQAYSYTVRAVNSSGFESPDSNIAGYTVPVCSVNAPDLTALAPNPPEDTAVAGISQTFHSTIRNTGNAGTGASFPVLFQTSTHYLGSFNVTDYLVTPNMSALSSNTNSVAAKNITFTTATTPMYVRACADKSSASDVSGTITNESNENNNCTAWMQVNVSNPPPVVDAGSDKNITLPTTTSVSVTGTATDSNGTITSRQWTKQSGPSTYSISSPTSLTTNITGLTTAGTYVFRLTAVDNFGASSFDEMQVTVASPTNTPPTASAGGDQSIILPTNSIDTTNSNPQPDATDSDDGVASHVWTYVSCTGTCGVTPGISTPGNKLTTFTGMTAVGTYTFRLTVTDNSGAQSSDDMQVTVSPGTPDLTANSLTSNPLSPIVGVPAVFSFSVTNTGTATTGTSNFNNLFQFDNDTDQSSAYANVVVSASPLPATNTATILAMFNGFTLDSLARFPVEEEKNSSNWFTKRAIAYTFPTAGAWVVRACADNNASFVGTIAESNENDNCSPWANVTVVPAGAPDLTAAAPTPAVATVSISQTYSATISNIGNVSTGASFPYFFQRATQAAGGGTVTDLPSSTMSALGATTNGTATSPSFSFGTTGTKSVRVCADKTNNVTPGPIVESNENNNCGPWTDVVVSVAGTPDLTIVAGSGDPTPTTAVVSVPQTYNAVISNVGTGSTLIAFPYFFQRASQAQGGGTVNNLPSGTTASALPAGGTVSAISPSFSFGSTGIKSVRVCADETSPGSGAVVAESNEGNNCSNWVDVNVGTGGAPAPDLTAAAPTPSSVLVNTAVTFDSVVSNQGNLGTGAGFNNFFQLASAPDGGGSLSSISVNTLPALANGANATVTSSSYTFSSAGNYSVRLCADNNASFAGSINESNEGNNCSAWTNVTVSVSLPAPTADIDASPNPINSGQTTTLTWSSTNADSCTGNGFSTGAGSPTSGSVVVGPLSVNTPYTVNCVQNGTPPVQASDSVTVIVGSSSPPPYYRDN